MTLTINSVNLRTRYSKICIDVIYFFQTFHIFLFEEKCKRATKRLDFLAGTCWVWPDPGGDMPIGGHIGSIT